MDGLNKNGTRSSIKLYHIRTFDPDFESSGELDTSFEAGEIQMHSSEVFAIRRQLELECRINRSEMFNVEDSHSIEEQSKDGSSEISDTSSSSEEFMYRLHDKIGLPIGHFGFLQWAFGPEGLTNLKVMAYGDFSHGRMPEGRTCFLVRAANRSMAEQARSAAEGVSAEDCQSRTFRLIDESDADCWRLIEEEMDFLSACPSGPLVRRDFDVESESLGINPEDDIFLQDDSDYFNDDGDWGDGGDDLEDDVDDE